MITPAAVQDRDAARPLIKALVSMYGRLQIIWADGGYLGALVNWVKQLRPFGKLRLEIVRRCDDVKGFKVLPRRWVVERTFGWLFKSRRLCRDYEVRLDHSAGDDSDLHDSDHGQALGSYMRASEGTFVIPKSPAPRATTVPSSR